MTFRRFPRRVRLVAGTPPARPAASPMSTLRPGACGTTRGLPQPTVVVADRWYYMEHVTTTVQRVLDQRARYVRDFGACEVVWTQQDSANPVIEFRVPNPVVMIDGALFTLGMGCTDGGDDLPQEAA